LRNDQDQDVSNTQKNFSSVSSVRIGTRASKLARLQTDVVVDRLNKQFPDLKCDVSLITTGGDKRHDVPIAQVGATGVFVKELEDALLNGEVDLVVHSLKDLPTELPEALELAGVLAREDARDVLISRGNVSFDQLVPGSRVATSSRRRAAQLSARRKDLKFVDIRGNIPTRLRKHDEGECDAIILAAAGMIRLELTDRIAEFLDYQVSIPAAGQGALGIECRSGDEKIRQMIATIDEEQVRAEIVAERTVLRVLGGGCSIPLGVLGRVRGDKLRLIAVVASVDGSVVIRQELEDSVHEPERLGNSLAIALRKAGAGEIIQALKELAPNMVSAP
jgi:hydroxymethylbilane synthase